MAVRYIVIIYGEPIVLFNKKRAKYLAQQYESRLWTLDKFNEVIEIKVWSED